MEKKLKTIYLLGAGRSGTTLLATVLNSHSDIITIGEMHQFYGHLLEGKSCSCGELVGVCSFWSQILNMDDLRGIDIENAAKTSESTEKHRNIPLILLGKKGSKDYYNYQSKINSELLRFSPEKWFLDSSKYIARYLLLKRNKNVVHKGVYLVRDVRGVVHSFRKRVQTKKKPVATILYYLAINFFGQIIYWIDKDVIKIKYEDFVSNPETTLSKIYEHIFESRNINSIPKNFEMPHIIGGNRMKTDKVISINIDEVWRQNTPRIKQIGYYMLSFPIMILNNYKI